MIRLAKLFTDGMTFQRRKPLSIQGSSDIPQKLSVILNGNTLIRDQEVKGDFTLHLPPQEAMEDAVLLIEGEKDRIVLKNIDIGEVWVAGGQSNMEFLLRYDAEADGMIQNADDPHLRFYDVGEYTFEGEKEITHKDNSEAWDRWMSFTPETAEYFSAVGTYFAKVLRETCRVPVAIIGCNWGGTTASAWLDESYLEEDPKLRVYLEEYRKAAEGQDEETYNRHHAEALAFLESEGMIRIMRKAMYGNVRLWDTIRAIPVLLKVARSAMPIGPRYQNAPGVLFRQMLSQITDYAVRGVIWYQGESDDQKADIYDRLFSKMILCWRSAWKEELPFLFVQLAPFGKWLGNTGEKYPVIREKQDLVSRTVPNTWMASIMDAGDEKDIHPKRKRPVGERLALLARAKVYGENILSEAPELNGAEAEDGKLLLRFRNAGDGLYIQGGRLNALEISIDGRMVKWDKAKADKDTVIIYGKEIHKNSRTEVRYARKAYCEANLYNSAGLCAKPFEWSIEEGAV